MKVLVTGGAGFIGSHLVRKLQKMQAETVVLDNLSTGLRQNLPAGTVLWEMDVRTAEAQQKIIEGKFDAIVHLTGQTMVDVSLREPAEDADQNVMGTVNVLEAARKSGVKRVIFASTAASYGDVAEKDLPVVEDQPLKPMSFYGLSKVTVEKYLAMYRQIFGLSYVALRFANVYGERQGDGGEGGVISIFTKRLAQGKDIAVYGDGGQTRDFIYAGDVAEGIWAAITAAESKANTVYNLSTQTETSLKELVAVLAEIAGREIVPVYKEARPGDIYRSMLSNERVCRELGWKPQMPLKEGLRRTYEHFCQVK